MGSLPNELSLSETRPSLVFKTINNFLSVEASIGSSSEIQPRLDQIINGLIAEKSKIEKFERELPLSKLLINDAIEILKKEYNRYQKIKSEEDDKMKWMSSCQLWTGSENKKTEIEPICKTNFASQKLKGVMEERTPVAVDLFKSYKNEAVKGAFLPFHGRLTFPATAKQREDAKSGLTMSGLSFLTPGALNLNEEVGFEGKSVSSIVPGGLPNFQTVPPPQQQASARKQRRCWSHELHKQFVYCLEQLGGSQVATPKQIRELMQVEGLTNDEVKSHLQKYRLHTQKAARVNSGSSGSNSGSPAGPLQSG